MSGVGHVFRVLPLPLSPTPGNRLRDARHVACTSAAPRPY